MEASPSRSDSFSHGWLRRKARPAAASFERLGRDGEDVVDDGCLGYSFNSSVASFIDMDPAELFSMRWTSLAAAEEDHDEFDFGLPCAGAQCSSPRLVGAGRVLSDGNLLPCEPGVVVARDGTAYTDMPSPSPSSPLFHSALSTPASVITTTSSRSAGAGKARTLLLSTRRILLRYLRFMVPLCRKVRSLPLRVLAPRSRAASLAASSSTSPARRSTSSSYASAAEYWCHGNADTAVRDAILYCKKSIGQDM
ncbi:hypothetical protein E2562_027097 [Oryza meyeriana var. granulata]|uniref:Membrane-associated kinase regulator 6 n=1 Tax=Oryza meyeriana var. granulata TaxID=110450 RepID=A0A6G1EZ72_9ORYZ|nr:hypothetical protein E2562_027097 [Oryza meyeriana var. granulata]